MLVTSLCCHEAMNPPRVVQTAIPDYPCCCFYPKTGRIAQTPDEICNF
ncbi:UNVERIFIED_ORG: hypothetical protein C7429_11175 [Pantoea allii]